MEQTALAPCFLTALNIQGTRAASKVGGGGTALAQSIRDCCVHIGPSLVGTSFSHHVLCCLVFRPSLSHEGIFALSHLT